MKTLQFLLLGALLFSTTSCLDLFEEIKLNKDGSGTYTFVTDFSKIFEDEMMKNMFKEQMKNGMQLDDNGGTADMDTLVRFEDIPDDKKTKFSADEKRVLQNAWMKMKMKESENIMKVTLGMEFEKVEDIAILFQSFQKVNEVNTGGASAPTDGLFNNGAFFSWKNKKLERTPMPEGWNTLNANAGEDNMAFMKLFLATATYNTVYKLPGAVKKTTIPNATIDGDEITVSTPLLDYWDGKSKIDGEIRYK